VIDDETQLIRQAQAGDHTALTALYDRYQPLIFTYLYYRLDDQATAEELTSEVFVRMVEKIDRYQLRGQPLLAWLYTIARNLRIDHHRQRGLAATLPLDEEIVDESDDPIGMVERRLAADCLRRALRYLTDDQQEVIVHKFVGNRSNAETATLMGKDEGAVKSMQHRALAALRRAIEKERCYEP
jgi:RNA polymerase sigma-70 factor (ECF subfamily)